MLRPYRSREVHFQNHWPVKVANGTYPKSLTLFHQRKIVTNDSEIDHLVYELYGLTAEEVNIVEGESGVNTPKP